MSSDINIILQLLQRQLSQVPPAYSPISPTSHSLAMYGLVPRSLEPLAPCAPLEDQELPTQEQVRSLSWLSIPPGPSAPVLGSLQARHSQTHSWGLDLGADQASASLGLGAIPNTARLPHQ